MTYRPAEAFFACPLAVRIPSFIYMLIALTVVGIVIAGELSPSTTQLHKWVVQDDPYRPFSSRTLALILMVGGVAAVIRSGMRGVRVRGDGIEYRDVVTLLPKLRRFRWAQIDKITIKLPRSVILDLWDGSRQFLPQVGRPEELAAVLKRVAVARAIPVEGGPGLDEIPEPIDALDE